MEQFIPKSYYTSVGALDVFEELWRWEAVYTDETLLKQFDDETGQFHSMREIDTTKLQAIKIFSRCFPQIYTLVLPQEAFTLIIRHDRVRLNIGKANDTGRLTTFIFGYETEKAKTFLVILPDNQCIVIDDYKKIVIS